MASNATPAIVLRPTYYLNDFWVEHGDRDVAELMGMSVGIPWSWGFAILSLAYFIRIWGPAAMATRKAYELRPWMIFFNSFVCGGYTNALFCVFFMTNYYQDCFDCSSYGPHRRGHVDIGLKYTAYFIIYAKLYDFIKPIISVLAKKREISHLHLLHLICVAAGSVAIVKINPGGIFLFPAICECVYQIVVYSYLTFTAASAEFRPSQNWKMCILFTRMFTAALMLSHAAFFLSQPYCGHPTLKLGIVIYSTLMLVMFPYDWYDTEAKRVQMNTRRRFSIINQTMFTASASQ